MPKYMEWWNASVWCRTLSQHPLPSTRNQPHFFISSVHQINQKWAKNPETEFTSHQILLQCFDLIPQGQWLRQVDLEYSHKRVSDKINMLKAERKPQKKTICIKKPGLRYWCKYLDRYTWTWKPVLREEQGGS